jgi:DNA-binding LytR/AlgR family response regulator
MKKKFNILTRVLADRLRLFLGSSLGVFLFILFFEPFALEHFDFDNRLLFFAGFAAILFFITLLGYVSYYLIIRIDPEEEYIHLTPGYLNHFVILALSTVALTFYIRYVGSVPVTFFIVFKIFLIGLFFQAVIHIYTRINKLTRQNTELIREKTLLLKQTEKLKEHGFDETIEFTSENRTENMRLVGKEVVMIRSADNYVELFYRGDGETKKKLIRNTLKNIEVLISPYSYFVRCHRTCIVNTLYVAEVGRTYGNHWLKVKGFSDKLPVSRQYLLRLREAL